MADNNIIKPNNKNNSLTMLAVLYFAGVLTGTILYCIPNGERLQIFDGITGNLISNRLEQSFGETLVSSFSGSFVLLLICFLLGFSAIAQPVELLVPVFQGLGAGVSVAGMYGNFGFAGIGISAVLVVPGAVISAFAIIIAAREAVNLSSSVCSSVWGKESSCNSIDLKLYFTKFVILCVILVAASLVESFITFLGTDFWVGLLGI